MAVLSVLASSCSHTPCGRPAFRHYRRSATCKAPRKRSFLVTMEKGDARAQGIVCKSMDLQNAHTANQLCVPCRAFDGDNNSGARRSGGGGSGAGGGCRRGGQGLSGGGDGDGEAAFTGHHLLAAAALGVAVWQLASSPATRPALASITSSGLPRLAGKPARAAAAGADQAVQQQQQRLRPRSRVMHLRCDGGATLVVPLTDPAQQQQVGGGSNSGGDLHHQRGTRVVDSPLQLSEAEYRMLADKQYRVKEVLRV